jgi:hypothetical protein
LPESSPEWMLQFSVLDVIFYLLNLFIEKSLCVL